MLYPHLDSSVVLSGRHEVVGGDKWANRTSIQSKSTLQNNVINAEADVLLEFCTLTSRQRVAYRLVVFVAASKNSDLKCGETPKHVESVIMELLTDALFWIGAVTVAWVSVSTLWGLLNGIRVWIVGNGNLMRASKLGKWAGWYTHCTDINQPSVTVITVTWWSHVVSLSGTFYNIFFVYQD